MRLTFVLCQKMRENFPTTTLLTSRSVNHGMHAHKAIYDHNDPICQNNIIRYFKNGIIDVIDGHVCVVGNVLLVCELRGFDMF